MDSKELFESAIKNKETSIGAAFCIIKQAYERREQEIKKAIDEWVEENEINSLEVKLLKDKIFKKGA